MTMTKSDLIKHIAATTKMTKKEVSEVISAEHVLIAHYIRRGGEVNLMGFGKFGVRKQYARLGRNPRTGEPLKINSKIVPFFKPGKTLRDAVN